MVNSLRKVDFSHTTCHYTGKKFAPPPLDEIMGAPLAGPHHSYEIRGITVPRCNCHWDVTVNVPQAIPVA